MKSPEVAIARPNLAFLGIGWIGRHRMEAIADSGFGSVYALSDPTDAMVKEAANVAPDAKVLDNLESIIDDKHIEGVVIATPSAMHAAQSISALEAGKSVFCQKPLARTAIETRAVVDAAREADKLLGVDFSYRFTKAMQAVYSVVQSGELGHIYAVQLTFHNAYGPDKSWFYDMRLSGGGCVIDLGIHLVDLALWALDFPKVEHVSSRLFSKGQILKPSDGKVEDYATATLDLEGGTNLSLNCSWNLPAGKEAIIEAVFYGTNGGVAFKNVNGSFYNFIAERYYGTKTDILSNAQDNWGGRAAVRWAERLSMKEGFNEEAENFIKVAEVLDRIYGR